MVAQGTVPALAQDPQSLIGPFLRTGQNPPRLRPARPRQALFADGCIRMATDAIHTVKPLTVEIPKGALTVVTGVSGSGKTTLVLESLVPGLQARIDGRPLPGHLRGLEAPGIQHVKLIDATPIGINIRSTVATYANVHDELRKVFARTPAAKAAGYKAGDFSYNTGRLRCPVCDGPAPSAWMCSSCPMWTFPARNAAVPATTSRPPASGTKAARGRRLRCRSLWR